MELTCQLKQRVYRPWGVWGWGEVGKTGRAEGTALQRPWGEERAPFHASCLTVGLPGFPKPSEPSRGQESRQGWQSPTPNSVPNSVPRGPTAAHGCLPRRLGRPPAPLC